MMNLTNKKKIFNVLFCVFLFFIVLSTDKVYAYEERSCKYKGEDGKIYIVQQDLSGVSKVYRPGFSFTMKDWGLLDSGCPKYLVAVVKNRPSGQPLFDWELTNEYEPSSSKTFFAFTQETSNDVEFDPNDQPEVNSCEDLIGKEVIDVIQEIFNWIRIAIPIIIIVMTIIDFSKSLFMDEESMKKSQKKFIKRLIIGIVIFFIPTLVMGILELINKIAEWNWIKAGICGLK